ncbi:regulator of MON1-CCZ1 complex [Centroberyx gerrardi]
MSEEHYLELCESPVQFENASSVNNVFFDEANKQVFAVRSGGATGVVVKGPDDKSSVAFRMDDKGEVKCIKFSIGNKILAVQRTSKSVDFINFIPDYPHTEFTQECKTKNASVLGFCWTNWNEIVFITDQGILFLMERLQPDIIISASEGYLWYLQVKLPPTVNLLQDKGKLMDFLLRRRDCKMVILSVCSQILEGGEKGSLPVVATVFDKLNQVYKEYLEAEQTYTLAMESGPSRGSAAQKRPVRTQAVIDQSDMYTHVLSAFTERKGVSHKFVIAVLMEYIRSLNQFQITVQHYLYELVIKTLVQHNLFYMLHQFLQYHVLSDSKPLACLLLSLESTYPPAHQLSLDMLKRLSTANDEIVEVLLSKQQVLGALRFIRSVGGHDNVSARKFLDAARQTGDHMLFYTVFRSFQQRNQRLRGSPGFNPGEHCEEHVVHFKQLFGEQALMKPATV